MRKTKDTRRQPYGRIYSSNDGSSQTEESQQGKCWQQFMSQNCCGKRLHRPETKRLQSLKNASNMFQMIGSVCSTTNILEMSLLAAKSVGQSNSSKGHSKKKQNLYQCQCYMARPRGTTDNICGRRTRQCRKQQGRQSHSLKKKRADSCPPRR